MTPQTSVEEDKNARRMVPMTKEEWEKQQVSRHLLRFSSGTDLIHGFNSSQNVIRKVYDPDTGRHRLVKGSGEILEEIVSYSRHKDINRDDNIEQIFGYWR